MWSGSANLIPSYCPTSHFPNLRYFIHKGTQFIPVAQTIFHPHPICSRILWRLMSKPPSYDPYPLHPTTSRYIPHTLFFSSSVFAPTLNNKVTWTKQGSIGTYTQTYPFISTHRNIQSSIKQKMIACVHLCWIRVS